MVGDARTMSSGGDCFVCNKHVQGDGAFGGVIFDDGVVYAGHASRPGAATTYLGYLVVEPRRHAAGLGDLTADEAARVGGLVSRLAAGLKQVRAAEHVYSFVFGDGAPHLHVVLVPRYPGTPPEYRGLGAVRLREWPDAPRGDEAAVRELCAQLRQFLDTTDPAR